MNDVLVEINQVSKQFSGHSALALDAISGVIPKGRIMGLVGPDGAGKTTLIRLMTGLMLPSKGFIKVVGHDTRTEAAELQPLIGYMPQKFGLYEDLSVEQNMNLYADLRGLPERQHKEVFDRLLTFTGLRTFTDRLARNLSGGMKQKLGLACALINQPVLLLLDEPSVGVDPISRRELWQMVHDLIDQGISVVWSTSYLDEAERCHSVMLLNEGKLLFSGRPQELTQRVQGRTFELTHLAGRRRLLLKSLLQRPDVQDGVVQGSSVRLLLTRGAPIPEASALHAGAEALLQPTPPRFEDAFIDALGGVPGEPSPLAERTAETPANSQPVVEARSLIKRFGTFTAAYDITFSVRRGEIFGLLGPNGAGKTTTFKMMCGLLIPTAGEAFVSGLHLQAASSEARAHIGYMAQKFSLYLNLSVYQNLWFFSGVYNLKGAHRQQVVDEMIATFNLKPYLEESADTLPLGFKQRLALACAVMHQPSVLFLDEPTSGVDPLTRREFWNHMNGLVEKGVTVMVSTHFMDEAEYCDRVALVYRSRIIALDTPDALKATVQSKALPNPTLEDAFLTLIQQHDVKGRTE